MRFDIADETNWFPLISAAATFIQVKSSQVTFNKNKWQSHEYSDFFQLYVLSSGFIVIMQQYRHC